MDCPGGLADEGDWLELLVASERTSDLLESIQSKSKPRRIQALRKLSEDVHSREAYAEEAQKAGAVKVLTQLIAQTDDEETLSLAADIIAACGGSLSNGLKARELTYGGHTVWIKEGSLGDGLGARVWIAAHILCRRLATNPSLVAEKDVLELGSGTGLCGILAARLGAQSVTLTDFEPQVLQNLRTCCRGNKRPRPDDAPNDTDNQDQPDSTDGDWDTDNMRVRQLDWEEARQSSNAPLEDDSANRDNSDAVEMPPCIPREQKYSRIIGSDVLYEVVHGELVACVISDRLAPDGKAIISLAVRRQEHLDRLLEVAREQGLQADVQQEEVDANAVGIVGREHEYEGGFVTVYFCW